MKLIAMADVHIRATTPDKRIDNFVETLFNKLTFVLNQCIEQKAALCIAGDLFDAPNTPKWLIRKTINLFNQYQNVFIYCVPGQHDTAWHSMQAYDNSPMALVEAACNNFFVLINGKAVDAIHGAGWNEEIPKALFAGAVLPNTCVTHRMVTDKGGEWYGHSEDDYTKAHSLLGNNDYTYWVSGDNHRSFHIQHNGKILVNPGSLMRLNSKQLDHKPRVGLINTETNSFEWIDVPIEPYNKVFDLNKIEKDERKKDDKQLKELIETIKTKKTDKPKFKIILTEVMNEAKPNAAVQEIISNIMTKVA